MYSVAMQQKLQGRVLVVDDAPDGRFIVAKILSRLGLTVETAEGGQEACDAAIGALVAGLPFDLILMDMQMPVMDGFSATGLLRSSGYAGRIVALTGMGEVRERCLRAGCNDHAPKPITLEALIALVQRNLLTDKFVSWSQPGLPGMLQPFGESYTPDRPELIRPN